MEKIRELVRAADIWNHPGITLMMPGRSIRPIPRPWKLGVRPMHETGEPELLSGDPRQYEQERRIQLIGKYSPDWLRQTAESMYFDLTNA